MVVISSYREMLGYVPQREPPLLLVASLKLGTLEELPVTERRKVGLTSHQHDLHVPGYTRPTMAGTEGRKASR